MIQHFQDCDDIKFILDKLESLYDDVKDYKAHESFGYMDLQEGPDDDEDAMLDDDQEFMQWGDKRENEGYQ